ncbi:eotaxin-like [Alligator mississippiensis]|uniref:Eotaxin-like n=1 Tax=Alligator mississippiensis TaxID=8496 RepID=A0A151MZF8_ALLMI|nr:eotaxin-like [Alligator mississippiensis]
MEALPPHFPKECCFAYTTKPIHQSKLVAYYKTFSDCALQSVTLKIKGGKNTCADPSKIWVKNGINHLNKRK